MSKWCEKIVLCIAAGLEECCPHSRSSSRRDIRGCLCVHQPRHEGVSSVQGACSARVLLFSVLSDSMKSLLIKCQAQKGVNHKQRTDIPTKNVKRAKVVLPVETVCLETSSVPRGASEGRPFV
eukprot:6491760-Amphidinium_carterae.1